MTIELKGVEQSGDLRIPLKAFTQPAQDAVIHFHWLKNPQGYMPYLVKVVRALPDPTLPEELETLEFRAVSLEDPSKELGPDGTGSSVYVVNLRDVRDVYHLGPTELRGLDSASYTILFLSDEFRKGVGAENADGRPARRARDPHNNLAMAMGGPKWPATADDVVKNLEAQLRAARAERDAAKAEFDTLSARFNRLQSKVRDAFEEIHDR